MTNAKRNFIFYVVGVQDTAYTVKLGKAVKNMGNVFSKIVKKYIAVKLNLSIYDRLNVFHFLQKFVLYFEI